MRETWTLYLDGKRIGWYKRKVRGVELLERIVMKKPRSMIACRPGSEEIDFQSMDFLQCGREPMAFVSDKRVAGYK